MSSRIRYPTIPPASEEPATQRFYREVYEGFQSLPFSFFSTSDGPGSSAITAPIGTLGIEGGSSTTKLWLKTGTSNASWEPVALGPKAYTEIYYPFSESVATQTGVDTSFSTYTTYLRQDVGPNVSANTTDGTLTPLVSGDYQISFDISMSGNAPNTEYDFELHVNGSEISHGVRLLLGAAGDIETSHINAIHTLSSNDSVSVHVKSDNAGGVELGTYNSTFFINKIN